MHTINPIRSAKNAIWARSGVVAAAAAGAGVNTEMYSRLYDFVYYSNQLCIELMWMLFVMRHTGQFVNRIVSLSSGNMLSISRHL